MMKVQGNAITKSSSSERKTAGSQYLCGFPFAVLAKCLQLSLQNKFLLTADYNLFY